MTQPASDKATIRESEENSYRNCCKNYRNYREKV